ncbi:glycoside hydrolase family 65 protein [Thalassobacillus sp. CUG 92003]|uniref:glycoside hydrolase family 65 protein n=1 Tax=Thalassobacillus sp. CUG 92003 TaxID=2736641 RepID=UPI0015E649E5|nr:glycoside hydrolase family 65 protein [Thalassobacillus sp. CUG 92003]
MSWKIKRHSMKETDLTNEESLFFLGNGYIGVRGNFEETYGEAIGTIRGTYLNAFHDVIDIPYGEKLFAFPDNQQKMLNVMDSQTIHVYLGEEKEHFSMTEGEVLDYTRTLHMDEGRMVREIHWKSPLGREIKVQFERLVSFVHRELFLINMTLTPMNFSESITVVSVLNGDVENYVNPDDPRVAAGEAKRLHVETLDATDECGFVRSRAENSGLEAASLTYHNTQEGKLIDLQQEDVLKRIVFTYQWQGEEGKVIDLSKRNIYVDTLRHKEDLFQNAYRLKDQLDTVEDEQLFASQHKYLTRFWQHADVEVEGDEALQEALRFNLYHLLQSVGRDKHSNISAKGLSGEGYEGHYFWDTEIYMFPVFLMTAPELAKQLLIYRYSILEHAKARAIEMGHGQGALFPWRTISGSECSSYFPAGTAQYHISADIAYSYIQYYHATGDLQFMNDYGAELLIETARLWIDIGHFREDGKFAIDDVTGPDEYTAIVNNNYYTNAMAKHNLNWANEMIQILRQEDSARFQQVEDRLNLREEELESFCIAAEAMFLPYDQERGINPQDDTFLNKAVWNFEQTPKEHYPLLLNYHPLTLYRYQVCKQADTVLAHFLLEDEADEATIRNSFDYYERVTTHDSSLSSCVFSMMAARVGELDKAYHYFQETARLDLDNTHGNTKDGLHLANMGGTWMAMVFGFAGLRIKADGLHLSPQLPEQWERFSFHLHYKGQLIEATVTKDDCLIRLVEEGEPVSLVVNEEVYHLTYDQELRVPH